MALQLRDRFGRRFPYLRLSVTEACNYRCAYCLPNGYRKSGPQDFLRPEEIGRLARAFVGFGVGKVRVTGGEPSVRRDLPEVIARIAEAGVAKVALTTNGWALDRQIDAWVAAGLTHLNVSVDSLEPAQFRQLTGQDRLQETLQGVERALGHKGLKVKLNAVLLAQTAAGGFEAFADYVRTRPIALRFIELMRTRDNAEYFEANHVPGARLLDWLGRHGWRAQERGGDDGPATEFAHPDFLGRIGLIAPYAPGFCEGCNRLRVTARGLLRLCLFGEGGVALRDLLQRDQDLPELQARIGEALSAKPIGHRLAFGDAGDARQLAQVGG